MKLACFDEKCRRAGQCQSHEACCGIPPVIEPSSAESWPPKPQDIDLSWPTICLAALAYAVLAVILTAGY